MRPSLSICRTAGSVGLGFWLACAAPAAPTAEQLVLRRYVPIEVYTDFNAGVAAHPVSCRYTYMDVEDTVLCAARPDANFGRSEQLRIADLRQDRILLAFRQLYRGIPPDREIRQVELLLVPAGPVPDDAYIEVYRVTTPWRDGGGDGTPPTWAATYRDRYGGDEHFRRPWTRPGGDADRLAAPSFRARLRDLWEERQGAYVLSGPGLVEDVKYWHGRHYRNYGWQIAVTTGDARTGPIAFYASDVFEEARRPALRIAFDRPPKRVLKKRQLPDLDVTYIERTPRYTRYNDNGVTTYERKEFHGDRPGIMKHPDYAKYQKHPQPGALVVFIAHVRNASDQPYRGPVSYCWKINDRVVRAKSSTGELMPDGRTVAPTVVDLGPWEEFTTRLEWEWDVDLADHRKVVLEFEVDPEQRIDELSEQNNALVKYVAAKTLKYWVERSAYEYVKDYVTCWGSQSFEDYLQWHVDVWNETYFDKSRFDDFAPDGCVVRTTLDDFEIVPDGFLGGGIHRAEDELDPRFDGEWGTEWVPFDTDDENARKGYYEFLQRHRVVLEPSLLHECSHQVWGAYDIYWSNIEYSEPTEPRGKCKVTDETGRYITRGTWYLYGGLMGGDDTRPNPAYWEGTGLYSANSVGGANANAAFRNGFFGDWQYDLPAECCVQLTSRDGTPLKGAKITLWQQTWKGILNENQVAADVPAGPDGVVKLPAQDSLEDADYTLITGHTLRKKNPWGRIDVVGQNITLLMRVDAHGQRDYRFIRVLPFNRALWSGHTERYVLPVACRISPSDRIDFSTDVALGGRASASVGNDRARNLIDGDVSSSWVGGASKKGDWIEIELPEPAPVGVIQIVQDRAHGEFFQRFVITTRPDAKPGARVEPFDHQEPEPFRSAMANEKDVNNQRPSERWVTYAALPRLTKVIRIEALDGGRTDVSEIRVFAEQ